MRVDGPADDDTQSFSVSEAVRAPVGTRLDAEAHGPVRQAATWMLIGLAMILVDLRPDGGFDFVPDIAGGVAILIGAANVGAVARLVGPVNARVSVLLLAIVHAVLLVPNDLPVDALGDDGFRLDVAATAQTVVALLGTSVTATVLARAHDAFGQLAARDRWARVRRWALVLAGLWLPFSLGAAFAGDEPTGIVRLLVGAGSIVNLVLGLWVLVLLARGLSASLNVRVHGGQ